MHGKIRRVRQKHRRQVLGEIGYGLEITVDGDHFEREEESERERKVEIEREGF